MVETPWFGEFHPQSSAELFHSRLASSRRESCPSRWRNANTELIEDELAAVGDDLIHRSLDGVDAHR